MTVSTLNTQLESSHYLKIHKTNTNFVMIEVYRYFDEISQEIITTDIFTLSPKMCAIFAIFVWIIFV